MKYLKTLAIPAIKEFESDSKRITEAFKDVTFIHTPIFKKMTDKSWRHVATALIEAGRVIDHKESHYGSRILGSGEFYNPVIWRNHDNSISWCYMNMDSWGHSSHYDKYEKLPQEMKFCLALYKRIDPEIKLFLEEGNQIERMSVGL
jgi:hypothetical protein